MGIPTADYLAMLARTTKRPVPPQNAVAKESDLHEQIRVACLGKGWLALHGSMAHRTHRNIGEPDFTVFLEEGKSVFIEAKAKSGKMRPEQLAFKAWAEKLGHRYAVVHNMQEFWNAVKPTQMKTIDPLVKAADVFEWRQVVANGGPPCFFLCEDRRFCGRAERWEGHEPGSHHSFVSLSVLLEQVRSVKPSRE